VEAKPIGQRGLGGWQGTGVNGWKRSFTMNEMMRLNGPKMESQHERMRLNSPKIEAQFQHEMMRLNGPKGKRSFNI